MNKLDEMVAAITDDNRHDETPVSMSAVISEETEATVRELLREVPQDVRYKSWAVSLALRATLRERERCAMIAEEFGKGKPLAMQLGIAARIRKGEA